MRSLIGKTVSLAALIGGVALAADLLPANALPLSTILTTLEQQGLSPIVEANFDDGVWEIEGFRGDRPVELHVDPLTGKSFGEHPDRIDSRPPATAKAASAIAKAIEGAGYSSILELEWEHDHWDVEAISANGHRKLRVAADTGKVLSDRADD